MTWINGVGLSDVCHIRQVAIGALQREMREYRHPETFDERRATAEMRKVK